MTDLHVRDFGDGPPVLFLHAGIATGAQWEPAARLVAQSGRRAIVPDMRGFGHSPDPTAPHDRVADLVAMLEELGAPRVAVAGWSFGGSVACALASQHPARVHALALTNSVPDGFERAGAVQASWELEEQLWNAGRDEDLVLNDLHTWVVGSGRTLEQVPATVVEETAAVLRNIVARARSGADPEGALDRTSEATPDEVLALAMPLLAVTSQHEHPDNADFIELLQAARPDLHSVTVPGVAHAGPLERPEAYAEAICAFLDDVGW